DVAQQLHATGVLVDLDLRGGHPDLPERRLAAERRVAALAAVRSAADQLASGPEVRSQRLGIAAPAGPRDDRTVARHPGRRVAAELAGADGEELVANVARGPQHGHAHPRGRP